LGSPSDVYFRSTDNSGITAQPPRTLERLGLASFAPGSLGKNAMRGAIFIGTVSGIPIVPGKNPAVDSIYFLAV
jgi:hypothetical protein